MKRNNYLILKTDKVKLSALDGSRALTSAKTFSVTVNEDIWDSFNEEPEFNKTLEITTQIYKIIKEIEFFKILKSISLRPKDVSFSQHQVLHFIENYETYLCPHEAPTIFLMKSRDNLYTISVGGNSSEKGLIMVLISEFNSDDIWNFGSYLVISKH